MDGVTVMHALVFFGLGFAACALVQKVTTGDCGCDQRKSFLRRNGLWPA